LIDAVKTTPESDGMVLAREAGVPFRPQPALDPIVEWIALMEVVQALCPIWPVSTQPIQGNDWRL
jgi:hypothetical protein